MKSKEGKKKWKGRKERITEDLTWKEEKIRWRLEQVTREEERRDNRVWVEYGRIRINEQWLRWDEMEECSRMEEGIKGG